MSKQSAIAYICQECGSVHNKWSGKCTACNAWNSITEESNHITPVFGKGTNDNKIKKSKNVDIHTLDSEVEDVPRTNTGISELDRVLGGGLVSGSAILIGGDPGIGKSTLLLQTVVALSRAGNKCLYISGEESVEQIKLRAKRLSTPANNTQIAAATSLNEILKVINTTDLSVLVIDSIQTIFNEAIESAPGTVSQVRACAFELIRIAKTKGIALILVGHVTKDGAIAGPKVLEHMVDTVLYFEGERGHQFRIIRAVKNRFGAANEIGVFEMCDNGLNEVTNPSAIFLPTKGESIPGSAIFVGLEGTRPILLEIQALVVPSFLATPRRAVVGWDSNRLAMMIAVLNARYGINLLDKEVYLNVVGGLKITEPAADLAVLAALISAHRTTPISRENVFFGEVGLSGELRQVVHYDLRLNEASKLGFKQAFAPQPPKNKKIACNIDVLNVNHIRELDKILGR
jgi:DNA repair protein RadA/Sms